MELTDTASLPPSTPRFPLPNRANMLAYVLPPTNASRRSRCKRAVIVGRKLGTRVKVTAAANWTLVIVTGGCHHGLVLGMFVADAGITDARRDGARAFIGVILVAGFADPALPPSLARCRGP